MKETKEFYVAKLDRCTNCGKLVPKHPKTAEAMPDAREGECPLTQDDVRRSIAIAAGLVFYRANFSER